MNRKLILVLFGFLLISSLQSCKKDNMSLSGTTWVSEYEVAVSGHKGKIQITFDTEKMFSLALLKFNYDDRDIVFNKKGMYSYDGKKKKGDTYFDIPRSV